MTGILLCHHLRLACVQTITKLWLYQSLISSARRLSSVNQLKNQAASWLFPKQLTLNTVQVDRKARRCYQPRWITASEICKILHIIHSLQLIQKIASFQTNVAHLFQTTVNSLILRTSRSYRQLLNPRHKLDIWLKQTPANTDPRHFIVLTFVMMDINLGRIISNCNVHFLLFLTSPLSRMSVKRGVG